MVDKRKSQVSREWPAALDASSFALLARQGLTLAEIAAHLRLPPDTLAVHGAALRVALAKGRTEGRAELKRAQYGAALDGRVTALERSLALLDDAEGKGGNDRGADGQGDADKAPPQLRVIRRILPSRERPPWEEDGG